MFLGFKLWKTGRLSMKTEKIKIKGSLNILLENIEKATESLGKEAAVN
jgi:hypothetical protein